MPTLRAEWQPEPSTSLAKRMLRALVYVPIWVWLVSVGVFVMVLCAHLTVRPEGSLPPDWTVILAPTMMGAMIVARLGLYSIGKASPRLRDFLKSRPPGGHPCEITIFRNERPIGFDEGILRFEDGMLVYESPHTMFRLRPQDVRVPWDKFADGPIIRAPDTRFGNTVSDSAWGFYVSDEPECRLFFLSKDAPGTSSFDGPLYAWLRQAVPVDGEAILPPLDVSPRWSYIVGGRRPPSG